MVDRYTEIKRRLAVGRGVREFSKNTSAAGSVRAQLRRRHYLITETHAGRKQVDKQLGD